jgi:uridine kinase
VWCDALLGVTAHAEDELLDRLEELVGAAEPRAARTRVLAIDGRTGSGKTTLGGLLALRLDAPVVQLEQIYPGWDGLQAGIDLLVDAVLVPLSTGHLAQVPRYDWLVGRFVEPWPLEPPELLIVEGVGAGARAAATFASVLVWLELAADERKRRALARDGEVFRPYWESWAAQEDILLAREQTPERADLVVDVT